VPLTPQRTAAEVVSPELVLVDPDLARQVRPVTLTGAWTPAVHAASIRARSRATPRHAATSPERFEALPKARPLPRLSVAAAGAAGCFLVLTTLGGAREYRPAEAPHQVAVKQVATNLPPAPRRTLPRASSTSKVRHVSKAQRVEWQPARFATFYRVVFVRGGAPRLQIATTRTALSVKTLRSGRGL